MPASRIMEESPATSLLHDEESLLHPPLSSAQEQEQQSRFLGITYPRPRSQDWKWWLAGFIGFVIFIVGVSLWLSTENTGTGKDNR